MSQWAAEYGSFVRAAGKFLATPESQKRVDNGVAFITETGECDIRSKIRFLKAKELTDPELDKVLETTLQSTHPQLYLDFLEGKLTGELATKVNGSAEESTTVGKPGDPSFESMWIVGQQVYAYRGSYTYHLVPIAGVDITRHDDRIKVAFMNDEGQWGDSVWQAPGPKGVVADIFPPPETIRIGTNVIVSVGDTIHDAYKEGAVYRIDEANRRFTVELTHDNTQLEVGDTELRTMEHPLIIMQKQESKAHEMKSWSRIHASQATFDDDHEDCARDRPARITTNPRQHVASESDLSVGAKRDASSPHAAAPSPTRVKYAAPSDFLTEAERYALRTYVRSFSRYPPLEVDQPLSFVRSFSDFVRDYGESAFGRNDRVMPCLPECQKTGSGKGYGVDVSTHRRHPGIAYLFENNPILDISAQCYLQDQMFVDPDFPPSRYSILGRVGTDDDADVLPTTQTVEYEWRRMSELIKHSCITAPDADDVQPGPFSYAWLPHLVSSLPVAGEFEEQFSPADGLNPYGCYTMRVFVDTAWYYVVVDDFVPVKKGTNTMAALTSRKRGAVYATLVEKVLAKLSGSYAGLVHKRAQTSPARVWELLTGGLAETTLYTLLSDRSLWIDNLKARVEEGRLCVLVSRTHGEEAKVLLRGVVNERDYARVGLAMGAYCFVLQAVTFEDGELRRNFALVKLQEEVDGDGSCVAGLSVSETVAKQLRDLHMLCDGTKKSRWLEFSEYMRLFESLVTCWHFANLQKCAVGGSFKGRSGGSLFDGEEEFFSGNHQYYLHANHAGLVACQLTLPAWKYDDGRTKPTGTRLQLHLFEAYSPDTPLSKGARHRQIFTSNMIDLVDDEDALAHPSVSFVTQLRSGGYILIPDVGCRNSEEDFSLRVWSNSNFNIRLVR